MDAADPSTSLVLPKKKKANSPKRFVHTPIPPSILNDPTLAAASLLPAAYNFELPKTAHRIRSSVARRAALQLPEGLLLFSLPLSHLLAPFLTQDPSNDVLILADPTYGACCLAAAVRSAFPDPAAAPRLAIAGTVQFISAVHATREMLMREGYRDIVVPQAKPLSAGEILGCTAPKLNKSEGVGAMVFVADERFHLEAFMIANPGVKAYREARKKWGSSIRFEGMEIGEEEWQSL